MQDPRQPDPITPAAGAARPARPRIMARTALLTGAAAALLWILAGRPAMPDRTSRPQPAAIPLLSTTRAELAAAELARERPHHALAVLAETLRADPECREALDLTEKTLRETGWHLPVFLLDHPLAVERIEPAGPDALLVALAGEWNTTVRWNLGSMRIEHVLFPLPSASTRAVVADPTQRRVVIERAGIVLLCDAVTLKPVAELGPLPDCTPAPAVVVFSPDGLLLAHPLCETGDGNAHLWQIRDAASGGVLRTSDPVAPDAARPLAAALDRRMLRVLHTDARILEIPVSPVRPEQDVPAATPLRLLHAQFQPDGSSAWVLVDQGPHRIPELRVLPPDARREPPGSMLRRFSWNHHPGVWSGLLRDDPQRPLTVDGDVVRIRADGLAPIHADSAVTAVAFAGDLCFVGSENGRLTAYQLLPRPRDVMAGDAPRAAPSAHDIMTLTCLTEMLAGLRRGRDGWESIDPSSRLALLEKCDAAALARLFPRLDFTPVIDALRAVSLRTPAPDATQVLTARLARARPGAQVDASSPAAQLAAALESADPQRIRDCLAESPGMPPLLRHLALCRIAWIEDRKGDALSAWTGDLPTISEARIRGDWDGWEQVDFSLAMEKLRFAMAQEIHAISLPEHAGPEQRQALVRRLMDAETLRVVGAARLSEACLDAARKLVGISGEGRAALMLAQRARNLGAAAEPCLRAEALALASMAKHPEARDRWVLLLTEHPPETHQPADYAEAAYCALESGNPEQAMEILNTGLHRFPADSAFALRAGWIALLGGHPQRARQFLLRGDRIGFATDLAERAAALLTIAATQSGATGDAAHFHHELLRINPEWGRGAFIDALDWPEDFKSALRQPPR